MRSPLKRMAWLAAVLWLVLSGPAVAESDRLALVIGNDDYTAVPVLSNATADATKVAEKLSDIGFKVTTGKNLDFRATNRLLSSFENSIRPGATVVLYFAGHGVAIGDGNYLLPTDVEKPEAGAENLVKAEAYSVDGLIQRLQSHGTGALIVLVDACRDNPFAAAGTRSVGAERGLARVDTPSGVFVLFSAGTNQTALDTLGSGDREQNSVFTRVLLKYLGERGLSHLLLAKRVQTEVKALAAKVNHIQQPAFYDQIDGEIVLNGVAPIPASQVPAKNQGLEKPAKEVPDASAPVPPPAATASYRFPRFIASSELSQWALDAKSTTDDYRHKTALLDIKHVAYLPMTDSSSCFGGFAEFEKDGTFTIYSPAEDTSGTSLSLSRLPYQFSVQKRGKCTYGESTQIDTCVMPDTTIYLHYLDEAGMKVIGTTKIAKLGQIKNPDPADTDFNRPAFIDCSLYRDLLRPLVDSTKPALNRVAPPLQSWAEQNVVINSKTAPAFIAAITGNTLSQAADPQPQEDSDTELRRLIVGSWAENAEKCSTPDAILSGDGKFTVVNGPSTKIEGTYVVHDGTWVGTADGKTETRRMRADSKSLTVLNADGGVNVKLLRCSTP